MSATGDAVVRMANQIARNFEAIGRDAAIAATADHIDSFWDPRMKAAAFALLESEDAGFSADAEAALRQVAGRKASQARARASAMSGAEPGEGTDAG